MKHKTCSQYHHICLEVLYLLNQFLFLVCHLCSWGRFLRCEVHQSWHVKYNLYNVCVCCFFMSPLRPCIDLLLPPALSSQSPHPLRPIHILPSFLPLIRALTLCLSKGCTVYIINVISSERSSPSILRSSPLSLSVFPSLTSSHDLLHSLSLLLCVTLNLTHSFGSIFISPSLSMSPPRSPTCNQHSVDERYDWT